MIKKNIAYFGLGTWDGVASQNSVRIMSILGRDHNVLFINYPFTLKDLLFGLLGLKKVPVKQMLGLQNRLDVKYSHQGYEVKTLTCYPILPINFISNKKIYWALLRLNNWILTRCINRYFKKINYTCKVNMIYGFNPFVGFIDERMLNITKSIYYCYDQIKAANWASKHGESVEKVFIKKVDHVVTTSRALFEEKKLLNSTCTLIQNGVDFELFTRAYTPSQDRSNTIGYVGVVDYRIDFELIKYIASALPDLNIEFVGRVEKSAKNEVVKVVSNVVFKGGVAYENVPECISTFDVCIIPFAHNEFTRNIYPIKINEYLATGKPVVTTDFANLQEFEHIVSICDSKEAFVAAIQRELSKNNVVKEKERIALARTNSWENRAARFLDLIGE